MRRNLEFRVEVVVHRKRGYELPIWRAKKVVSDSLGLVDFAIGLANSVLNLPDRQVIFWGNSKYRRTAINPAHQFYFRLVEMTFGLVHARYSLT